MPFERNELSITIETKFRSGEPGDIISFEKMEALTGVECKEPHSIGRMTAYRILKKVERDLGICWRWCRDKKHWHCLTNDERPSDVEQRERRIKSQAKRNVRVCQTTNFDELNEKDRAAMIVSTVLNGLISIAASKKTKNQLTDHMQKTFIPKEEDLIEMAKARLTKQ